MSRWPLLVALLALACKQEDTHRDALGRSDLSVCVDSCGFNQSMCRKPCTTETCSDRCAQSYDVCVTACGGAATAKDAR